MLRWCKRRFTVTSLVPNNFSLKVHHWFTLLPPLICSLLLLLDGFQWSHGQQASHVISVEAGSDVSLPCEYELTPQEQQEADVFHLLTWTREEPHFSDRWTGLAINSTLSESKVIYDDPQRIFIVDGTLTVKNITVKDRTRYQCAFQSSFFTTPSIINVDVKCEYQYRLNVPKSIRVKLAHYHKRKN